MADAPTLGELTNNESAADTARAVMAELDGTETGGEPDDVSIPAEGAGISGGAAPTDGRARDEHGRFVSKAADGTGESGQDGEGQESGAESAPEDLEPPPEWAVEEQEQFRSLTPEARRIVLARVTAAQEAAQQAEALRAHYGGIDQLIAPRKQFWERDGLDEVGGIRQLLALSDFAAQDAPGFLRWFAAQRGLNPYQIWQLEQQANGQQPGQFEYVDPEVQALKQRLDTYEQYLQNQQQQQVYQQQAAVQAEYSQVHNELSEFVSAKDDKGRSKHPYFEEVRPLMGSFYGSGQASDLNTAYDMACRAHPGVYAKIEAANRSKAAQDQARQQREKAANARQAGSSVSGTPGDRAKSEPSGDLREDLRREFQERGMLRA